MKLNLFGAPKKMEFAPVGQPGEQIYLLKRSRLKVKENPMDLQTADRKQAEMIALIGEAQKRLALAKNIDEDTAREWFFPTKTGNVEVLARATITEYLDFNDRARFYEINASASTKYKVATLFIKHRLGYHVEVTESTKAKSADLEVAPLRWELAIGETIQFDSFRVEVTEAASIGDERIYIKPLPQKLERGAVGFVVDFETNSLKVGLPSFTDADTQELDEAHVDAIYEFYQDQIGLKRTEGKSQTPTSDDSSNPSPSTGSSATAESNGTELATLNSRSTDLATATVS